MYKPNEWFLEERFGYPVRAETPADMISGAKVLLIVAGADGEVSPRERRYLYGVGRALGIPEEVLQKELDNFDYKNESLEKHLAGIKPGINSPNYRLIYE